MLIYYHFNATANQPVTRLLTETCSVLIWNIYTNMATNIDLHPCHLGREGGATNECQRRGRINVRGGGEDEAQRQQIKILRNTLDFHATRLFQA